jgi:FSR family fosmidomycin resistance protein-like MFS transporter
MGSALSGNQLGKGMSFWMVGGELGRTLGPLITVTALTYLTITNFPWLMMGGILISVFLYFKLRDRTTITSEVKVSIPWRTGLKEMRRIMIPLSLLMISRSMISASLTIFLPTFLTREGSSLWFAGASLTILEASGMVGALLAGSLSDRLGRRLVMTISFITTPILMFLFLEVQGIWRIPLLVLLGFSSISIVPVILAVVMENFKENRSFANGVYMALSFVISAAATFGVGLISDLIEMRVTFLISAGLMVLGIPAILCLPKSHPRSIKSSF